MAYAEWTKVQIRPENVTLKIKNISLNWGKLYDGDDKKNDKDRELSASDFYNKEIRSGESIYVAACGAENSWTGTDGQLDLFDGEVKLGTYSWDSPWGNKDNKANWNYAKKEAANGNYAPENDYKVTVTAAKRGGPLGDITLICTKIA